MATVQRRTTRRVEKPINLDPENPIEKVRQFLVLKFQETQVVTRKNHLRDEISAFVDATGETDEKGSKFWKLPAPIEVNGQRFTEVKREKRTSVGLDEDASTRKSRPRSWTRTSCTSSTRRASSRMRNSTPCSPRTSRTRSSRSRARRTTT
jgi:hypothetical protein